jgi:hypothetical protein
MVKGERCRPGKGLGNHKTFFHWGTDRKTEVFLLVQARKQGETNKKTKQKTPQMIPKPNKTKQKTPKDQKHTASYKELTLPLIAGPPKNRTPESTK